MESVPIDFHCADVVFTIDAKAERSDWLRQTIENEGKTLQNLSIVLCSDDYLHDLNQKYLEHDTYTDIITFDLSIGTEISGEIYISTDRAEENANKFNVSMNNELDRLFVHGILHLCGYSDKSEQDKSNMTSKEDYYLNLRPF